MLKNAIQEGIQQKMFRDQSADATACSFFAVLMLLAFTGYIQDPAEDAANMANNFLYGIVTPTPTTKNKRLAQWLVFYFCKYNTKSFFSLGIP